MTTSLTMHQPGAVAQLVLGLTAAGVTLEERVTTGARRLMRLSNEGPAGPPPTVPDNLLDLDEDGLVSAFRSLALTCAIQGQTPSSGPAARARALLMPALARQVATELVTHADEILDDLRPEFDQAAAVVHDATLRGVHPGTTDRDVVKAADLNAMAAAWRALPAAVGVLERTAALRIDLTETAGVPPQLVSYPWNPAPTTSEYAGALFRPDAPTWHREFEQPWQKWVRLSTGQPVQLLTVAEAEAAWDAHQRAELEAEATR